MQPIAIASLSVCIALLCLSQSESLTGPSVNLHNLKNTTCKILPCPTQPSPFKLCVPCVLSTRPRIPMQFLFLLVQGSHHSPHTHIGRSAVCQTEGKRFYTVPVQYRPLGRAEDQEAGPVGAGGAWPVRPAACRRPRQAYRMLLMAYRMIRYCIRRRSAISYMF